MAKFTVNPQSLRDAATKVENEALNYENASKVAKSSADTLASSWVGDAQKAFVAEQEKANAWYLQMAELARQFAAFLRKAASEYEIADSEATQTIGAK